MRFFLGIVVLLTAGCMAEGYSLTELEQMVKAMNETIHDLSQQMILSRFYAEETVRSNGNSGIKQVRHQRDGTRPYFMETHIGSGVASIHDHADSVRTMGMGEFHVVLNGVEFRTRHNDYLLKMPSKKTRDYHAIEDIPFPPVPPSVLAQPTVSDQIKEMREYFKAFKMQDPNIRPYQKYFKPVLSYLEGAWTYVGEDLEEPFPGERHWIEADTWEDLDQKALFVGQTGNKEPLENLAYLPRAIVKIKNSVGNVSQPVYARWNYRILCHPIEGDLPLNRLMLVDDLASRMVRRYSMAKMHDTREARFKLAPAQKQKETAWSHGRYVETMLDQLMAEIPGKNNYNGDAIKDSIFGHESRNPNSGPLNSAYYHHLFKIDDVRDGMGMQVRHRGFSDETLFMARTTHPKVAETKMKHCDRDTNTCTTNTQRWSYAIPMEIIYMTPLARWNPYNIKYHGWSKFPNASWPNKDRRDGSYAQPFNGTNSKHFFQTPVEFFSDSEYSVSPADTTRSNVFVLDSKGITRNVRASGHRIFIPEIMGVGRIRQRYPIMPIHTEGTTAWKELDALKEIVLNPNRYASMMYNTGDVDSEEPPLYILVTMSPAAPKYGGHIHELDLTQEDFDMLYNAGVVEKTTTENHGHSHSLLLQLYLYEIDKWQLKFLVCDGEQVCFDGHDPIFPQAFSNNGTILGYDASVYNVKQETERLVSSAATNNIHTFMILIIIAFFSWQLSRYFFLANILL